MYVSGKSLQSHADLHILSNLPSQMQQDYTYNQTSRIAYVSAEQRYIQESETYFWVKASKFVK